MWLQADSKCTGGQKLRKDALSKWWLAQIRGQQLMGICLKSWCNANEDNDANLVRWGKRNGTSCLNTSTMTSFKAWNDVCKVALHFMVDVSLLPYLSRILIVSNLHSLYCSVAESICNFSWKNLLQHFLQLFLPLILLYIITWPWSFVHCPKVLSTSVYDTIYLT